MIEYYRIIYMKLFILSTLAYLAYSGSTSSCGKGSVPDKHHMCIRPIYIEGCYSYESERRCSKCSFGYQLCKTGLCTHSSQNTESCCKQTGPNGCRECNLGLALIDGKCVEKPLMGCLEKDEKGDCQNCASDFVLQADGTCKKGIKDCQFYQDKELKVCDKCQPGYSMARNLCLKNHLLGCKHEDQGTCTRCYRPFRLSEGRCIVDNCKAYNDFGCQSCECGYHTTKRCQCKKLQQGCVRFQRGVCTDCYPPYTLQGIGCTIDGCERTQNNQCQRCSKAYKLVNGACKLPNCMLGRNGKCEICEDNFSFVNGQCEETTPRNIYFQQK